MNNRHYNHLGFHNPYYTKGEDRIYLHDEFQTSLEHLPALELNVSSVIEVVNNGYVLGDKTLVKGLNKSPWMAKINNMGNGWDRYDVPSHGSNIANSIEVSSHFFKLLEEELLGYIGSYRKIGILLTGGMDSRVVACVLHNLQKKGDVSRNIEIKAFTWGKPESRDVVYGQEIAEILKWDWEHLTVDKYQMMDNLKTTIKNGSEYSPIHLHAMSQLSQRRFEVECFLAGSFGDSIGRAEYSGVRVENLKRIYSKSNNFGVMKRSLVEKYFIESKQEIDRYHNLYPQTKPYEQYEQDYQLHYMRRMLNSCMSTIDRKIPLFQMFSSPKVFGYMWSLSPRVRNNEIYRLILEKYNRELLNIPWARTGLRYYDKTGQPDRYLKSHHDYGDMIRNEFLPTYKDTLLDNNLDLFNPFVIRSLIGLTMRAPIKNGYSYEGLLIWMISLIKMCEKFDIKSTVEAGRNELDFKRYSQSLLKYFAKYIVKR